MPDSDGPSRVLIISAVALAVTAIGVILAIAATRQTPPQPVAIPAVPAPEAHFRVAEDAVKLSLEQEERVTTQINALVSMAKAECDYTTDNFLQWFVKEQLEEVASMEQLLRVVQRAGEGDLLRVEEYLAREKGLGAALSEEE